jgi:uncharacterized protein (DUF1778 family)
MATKAREVQISAVVSKTTKEMLEKMVKARGLKKGYVVEEALRHHLQALQELPEDIIIPSTIVLTNESFKDLVREIERPRKASARLRRLMSRRHGD